jgi:L,D-peptidoglycan transpeptidase YkuD (ErfK/YbiS/YcfS/YnhG family)
MRKLGLLAVAPLTTALALPLTPAHADVTHRSIGGVRVGLHAGTRQVVTVNHRSGDHATVAFWRLRHGHWKRQYVAHDGRIGYGGLVAPKKRRQGTGTTPLGTTRLISSFGRHARGRYWDLPYRRIQKGDYWVEDNGSRYYNRYRNKARGGFRWWLPASNENSSERLLDYPRQYEYSIVTSYNRDQVRHRGAGIFLHVNGSGATAGCVSAPRWFLKKLMVHVQPKQVPVMAVGR